MSLNASLATTDAFSTTSSFTSNTTTADQSTTSSQNSTTTSSSSTSTSTSTLISTPSFAPASTTTRPPIPSSSSSQQTTVTSAYTVYLSASPSLSTTAFPSTIPASSPPSSSNRNAIIAGSAAGGTALIILLLSLAFYARRKRFKQLAFIARKRNQARSRATLLDGEDDDVFARHPPRHYTDHDLGSSTHSVSAVREDVWPPPNEGTRLMDPLSGREDVDLGRIVDDVMGPPSGTAVHFSDQSVSSVYRASYADTDGPAHSRTVSNASNAALLDAAGLSTGPVRSSPLAQPESDQGA